MTTTEETTAAEEEEVAAADMCCASCGVAAIDDVKLKKCDGGCDLVKYCSDKCQNNHRGQHDEECKERSAELREKDLFEQPDESHLGECPLCCLPMPLDQTKSRFMSCCSKSICNGCHYANQKREYKAGLMRRCAFCREPLPKSGEEIHQKRVMKRVKKNDPVALCQMGNKHYHEGDHETAFEYFKKAAELGDTRAHYNLSIMYHEGRGVENDMEKYTKHSEEAAIGGHVDARYDLGIIEKLNGRFERAKKHFIIAANLGDHDSLKGLMKLYANGLASKEDYAGALRAFQAAVAATKSVEREEADAYYEAMDAAQQS
jgi:tetratricopeptide (TPR) repeat protein